MNSAAHIRKSKITSVALVGALVLVLALTASVWIFAGGSHLLPHAGAGYTGSVNFNQILSPLAELMNVRQVRTTIVISCSSAALMLGWIWSRSIVSRKYALAAREGVEARQALEEAKRDLEEQTFARKKLEGDLRKFQLETDQIVRDRTVALAAECAHLEEELNKRKQAEKALSMQTKELERSKDVLELHVQARTQELQKLKGRYELILNSAGEGIYGLDLKGNTTFVNPAAARITGWDVDELIAKPEHQLLRESQPICAGNGEGSSGYLAEQIFSRKDGNPFPVEYVRTPIIERERLVGAVVIFRDITERKRTEDALSRKAAELARSNAELEQFAYVASHDLQEPLRKIQAFGDRLKTRCDAAKLEDGRDYLERMQSAAARMQTLINDLLTFSRVISSSQPFVPVDLGAITKEVLADLEVRVEQTKACIEVSPLPAIDADPLQMRQLLQNLIGNALKFQPPANQPLIKIYANYVNPVQVNSETSTVVRRRFNGEPAQPDEFCELVIEDNGIGFDEKYSEKIFAVFQRLHGRNEYEGTGVGLAVCRRITDRHGGTLTARSKPGEGATFIATLPVHKPPLNKTT